MLTYYCDRNMFAKACRTDIYLIYANMHMSGFILIIKMRALWTTDCYAGESLVFYTSSLIINSNIELGWNRWDEREQYSLLLAHNVSHKEITHFFTLSDTVLICGSLALSLCQSLSLFNSSRHTGKLEVFITYFSWFWYHCRHQIQCWAWGTQWHS